jgi:hypothetical protein
MVNVIMLTGYLSWQKALTFKLVSRDFSKSSVGGTNAFQVAELSDALDVAAHIYTFSTGYTARSNLPEHAISFQYVFPNHDPFFRRQQFLTFLCNEERVYFLLYFTHDQQHSALRAT